MNLDDERLTSNVLVNVSNEMLWFSHGKIFSQMALELKKYKMRPSGKADDL